MHSLDRAEDALVTLLPVVDGLWMGRYVALEYRLPVT